MNSQQRQALENKYNNLTAQDRVLLSQLAMPTVSGSNAKRPWVRVVARMMVALYLWQTGMAVMPVYAQGMPKQVGTSNLQVLPITASPQAPVGQKPIIDAAANGVRIVLIAPPGASGVSRNQYDQFNVGQSGLILNNSKGNVSTQLGGIISGNLQLGTAQARIILNEVVSTNSSQINGYIEVAGQKADIVIANPNGISCDGCGFLNTAGRATLTTGKAEIEGGGSIGGFDVRRGIISVKAGGLNASNIEQLDLLARGIVIEGEVSTKNLKAILGSNKVLYGTLKATPQEGGGAAPKFAIDIAQLGGMYANQVYLIANEKGLGVNSSGRIASLEENLTLSVLGDVTLKDSYSKKNVIVGSAGVVTLTGQTSAGNNIKIDAPAQINNAKNAVLSADQQVEMSAKELHNSGTIIQKSTAHALVLSSDDRITNDGVIYSATDLSMQSGTIGGKTGILQAANGLKLQAQSISFNEQQLFAHKDLNVSADTANLTRSVIHADTVSLNGNRALNTDGSEISALRDVRLSGAKIVADKSVIIADANLALAGGDLNLNGSQLSAGANLTLTGGNIQAQQTQLAAQHQVAVIAKGITSTTSHSGDLNLRGSTLVGRESVTLQGSNVSTALASISAPELKVKSATGQLDNDGGVLYGSGNVEISASGINNRGGQIASGKTLVLDAQGRSIDNFSGLISAPQSILLNVQGVNNSNGILFTSSDLKFDGAFENLSGKVVTSGAINFSGTTINNAKGVLQAGNAVQLNAGMVNNQGGLIQSTGSGVSVLADTLDNSAASIAAGGNVEIKVGTLQNTEGNVSANGKVNIGAMTINSNGGKLGAGGDLSLKATSVNLVGAQIGSNGVMSIDAGAISAAQAQFQSGGAMTMVGGSLSADRAQFASGQDVKLMSNGGVQLNNASIAGAGNIYIGNQNLQAKNLIASSGNTLIINSKTTDLQAAQLSGAGGLKIASGDLDLTGASVASGNNLTVKADSQKGGNLSAQGNLDVVLQNGLDLTGGTLIAGHSVTVKAQGIVTNQAKINGNQVSLDAGTKGISNLGGQIVAQASKPIVAGSALNLHGDGIDNTGGTLYSGADAVFDANGKVLDNSKGNIAVLGNMLINASKLKNNAGSIATGSSINLIGLEVNNSQGKLQSGADISIETQGQTLNNNDGLIQAQGKLALAATEIRNAGGNFSANKTVDIVAQSLDNSGAKIASGLALTVKVAGAIDSEKSIIRAGGALSLSAQKINVAQSAIASQDQITLAAQQDLNLDLSDVQAGSSIKMASDSLSANAASIKTNGDIRLVSNHDIGLNKSKLSAIGPIDVVAQMALNLQQAQILTNDNLSLKGSGVNATQSTLNGGKSLNLSSNAGSITLDGSTVASGATLQIDAQGGGSDLSALNADIAAKNSILIDVHGGSYLANGSVHRSQTGGIAVNANNILAAAPSGASSVLGFLAQSDIALNASGQIDVSNSVVSSGRHIVLTANDGISNAHGQIVAKGSVTLSSSAVNNNSGVIDANDALNISATHGGVDSQNGSITTRGQLTLETLSGLNRNVFLPDAFGSAIELNNANGNIVGMSGVRINSGAVDNSLGQIASGNKLTIATGSKDFNSAKGALLSQGAMSLTAGNIDLTQAQARAGLGLDISGQQIMASGSAVSSAGGDLSFNANGAKFDASGSDIQSSAAININAGAANIANAKLVSGASVHVQTAGLDAHQAQMSAGGDVGISSSGSINGLNAKIATNGKLDVTASSLQGGKYTALGDINVITSGSVDLGKGALVTDAALAVTAQGIILTEGKAIASRIKLDAGTGALDNQKGTIVALDKSAIPNALQITSHAINNAEGNISSNGDITLLAGTGVLNNQDGVIGAAGNLLVDAGDVNNAASTMSADKSVTIDSLVLLNHGGSIQAGNKLLITATGVDNSKGQLLGANAVALTASNLDNSASALIASNGNVTLNTSGSGGINNDDSRISGGGNLDLVANGTGAISNRGGKLEAGGKLNLSSGASIDNHLGDLSAGNAIHAQSLAAFLNDGGKIGSGSSVNIITQDAIANHAGKIESASNLSLSALKGFDNDAGRIVSNGNLNITAKSLTNRAALISSGSNLNIDTKTIAGAIDNQAGQIQAGGIAVVAAQGINNQTGTIVATQNLTVDAGHGVLDNRAGGLQSVAASLQINAAEINNRGAGSAIISGKNLNITSEGNINNQQAWISAGESLTVNATGGVDNSLNGTVGAGKDLVLVAQGFLNNHLGSITAGNNTAIQAVGIDNRNSLINAAAALTLQASTGLLDNADGKLLAGTSLTASATGLNNLGGVIAANEELTVQADNGGQGGASGKIDNRAGQLVSILGSINISSGDLLNQRSDVLLAASNGQIKAAKDITINARGFIENSNSAIAVSRDLKIKAEGVINNDNASLVGLNSATVSGNGVSSIDGNIASNGKLTLSGGNASINNTRGFISGANDTSVTSTGAFNNDHGTLQTAANLITHTGDVYNQHGLVSAQGSIDITSGQFDNRTGEVIGQQAFSVNTQGQIFDNTGGKFSSNGDIDLKTGSAKLNSSVISTGKSFSITSSGAGNSVAADNSLISASGNISFLGGEGVSDLSLNHSKLEAGKAISLSGKSIALQNSTLAANDNISIKGGTIDASNARVSTQKDIWVHASNLLSYRAASFTAGRDLSLTGAGLVDITGADLKAGRNLELGLGQEFFFNTTGFKYQFGGDLAIRAVGIKTAGAAVIGTNLTLDAGTGILDNRNGSLQATGFLALKGNGINNQNSNIIANQQVNVDAGAGQLNNSNGNIGSAQANVNVSSGTLTNSGGNITAAGALTVHSGALQNSGGRIVGDGLVSLNSSALDNTGGTLVSNSGSMFIGGGSVNNAASTISAAGQLIINVDSVNNIGGRLIAGSDVSVSGGSVNNANGSITGASSATVSSKGNINNRLGLIQGTGSNTVVNSLSGDIDNAGGQIVGTSYAAVNAGGTLYNGTGRIASGGAVSISSHQLENSGGIISAMTIASVTGADINNAGGVISGLGSVFVTSSGLGVNNDAGVIESGIGGITINTGDNGKLSNNNSGAARGIVSEGNITIGGGELNQSAGYIGANGTLTINSSNLTNTDGGTMLGLSGASVVANGTINNQGGNLKSGKSLTLAANSLSNIGGTVFATEDLSVNAGAIDNSGTKTGSYDKGLLAGRDITITGSAINNNGGAIVALRNVNATATASITNLGGQFAADDLTINTPDFTNTGGRVDARTKLTSMAKKFSADGVMASGGTVAITMDGDYTNTGTVAASGNLTVTLNGGKYTNAASGVVSATSDLILSANGLDNSGMITAGGNTTLNVGNLNNLGSGVVNAGGTSTVNGSVNNFGKIFGGDVIANGAIINKGNATIGARNDLYLGGSILNAPNANILSTRKMTLGSVVNAGGRIDSGSDMTIGSLANLNCSATDLGGSGSDASGCASQGYFAGLTLRSTNVINAVHELSVSFPWDPRSYKASELIYHPEDHGYFTFVSNGARAFHNWGENLVVQRQTEGLGIAQSNPGKLNSGGNITIGGGQNIDSQIVASGNISMGNASQVGDGNVQQASDTTNISTKGTQTNTDTVNHLFSHMTQCGGSKRDCRETLDVYTYTTVTNSVSDMDAVLYKTGGAVGPTNGGDAASPVAVPAAQVPSSIGASVSSNRNSNNSKTGAAASAGNQTANASQNHISNTGGAGVTVGVSNPDISSTTGVAVAGNNVDSAGAIVTTNTVTKATTGISTNMAGSIGNTGTVTTTTQGANNHSTETATIAVAAAPAVSNAAVSNALPGSVIAGGLRTLQQGKIDAVTTQFGTYAAARLVSPKEARYNGSSNGANLQQVGQGQVNVPKGTPGITLTANTKWTAPSGNLFSLHPKDGAGYLVETDPLFTDKQQWLGSDYFLTQLNLDPSRNLKRYGDGFVEQRAFADQLISITGRNKLSGYDDNQQAFQALMDAGVAYAKEFHLSPGVALSDQQMALLTTDIVWLQEETVTLPDGSTTQALVPQVYLRRPQGGDLATGGALIAGNNVTIRNKNGDINNSGTILAGYANGKAANGTDQQHGILQLDAVNVSNRGTVAGNIISINAANDINNLGGKISGLSNKANDVASVGNSGANGSAGRINSGNNDSVIELTAGRDITLASTSSTASNAVSSVTNLNRIATINAGNIRIDANGNITGKAAQIDASNNLVLVAGKNIDITTLAENRDLNVATGAYNHGRSGYVKQASTSNVVSNLSSGNNLIIVAKGDTSIVGSNLLAANDASIAGSNVTISAAKDRRWVDVQGVGKDNYARSMSDDESLVGGNIAAGNKLLVAATGVPTDKFDANGKTRSQIGTGNLKLLAANLSSGTGSTASTVLVASNDINILNLTTLHSSLSDSYSKSSGVLKSKSSTQSASANYEQVVGSTVAGNAVLLKSGNDSTIQGSNVTAAETLQINAGRDLNIASSQQSSSQASSYASSKGGISFSLREGISAGKSANAQNQSVQSTEQVASNLSAANISTTSGRDTSITASTLIADQDIHVDAGRNLNILAAANSTLEHNASQSSSTSYGNTGGASLRATIYGKNEGKQTGSDSHISQSTSALSANGGNLSLKAGTDTQYLGTGQGTLTTQGTDLLAKDKVTLVGNAVDLQAIHDESKSALHSESKSLTVGAQLAGALGSVIMQIADTANAASQTDNKRLQGALTLKAGYDAYKLAENGAGTASSAVQAAKDAGMPASGADAGSSGIGISVNLSSSKSSNDSKNQDILAKGTNIQAGSIDLTARGKATGDIHMEGAKLQAKDISLDAANNIKLDAAANTNQTQSKNSSSSVGSGATLAVGGQQNGLSFQLSASMAKGRANGSQTTYDNTLITATDHLSIKSGNDTILTGAQLAGKKVNALIGGDFTVVTLQDLSSYDNKQESAGFNLSVCIPPICYGSMVAGGINYSKNTLSHNYQSAVGQSGIAAGTDGFDINVKGNTALTGGAITSAAAQDKNSLSTAGLSYTDLANKENTKATSISVSASTSNIASNVTANVVGNLAGQAGLPKSGSSAGETKSVISPANISITGTSDASKDQTSQTAATTLTSRDASTANGSLKNTLNLQQIGELQAKQREQAENQAAANAIGTVVTNVIGDLSQKMNADLQKQEDARAKAAGDTAKTITSWGESSPEKILLHGLAGVIEAKLGGTSIAGGLVAGAGKEAVTGAMSAYLASQGIGEYKADPKLSDAENKVKAKADKDNYNSLMNLGSTLVGAATGAVAGGNAQSANAGANVALIADINNRQLHPNEAKWIRDNAKRYAAQNPGMTEAEAEKRLADQAFKEVQFGVAGATDLTAQAFLKNNTLGIMLPGDSTIPGQNVGYMFRATPEQKLNANMYLNEVRNSPQALEFYQRNQIKQPNLQQIMNAATTDSAKRSVVLQRTIMAAVAAGSLVLAPAFAGTAAEIAAFAKNPIGYCLGNPIGCTIAGTIGTDVVATTVAGVPVSGVSIPSVGSVAGKLVATEAKVVVTEVKVVAAEVKAGASSVSAANQTIISAEMENKILFGERVVTPSGTTTNRVIGAHSGDISNANPNYAVDVISVNADGTQNVKLLTQFADGNVSNVKTSTLFPNTWTNTQTLNAVKQTGDIAAIAIRSSDGAALYQATVNGVKIEVIKIGNNVTAAYPAGSRGFQSVIFFMTGKN